MEELISVIVPAYHTESYIDKCICSILEQTYRNFELIIIDDGSEDNTAVICAKYAQSDRRIRYIFQENAGVSAARNNGLRESKGQYITFVDSDDWIDTRYLEELYMAIQDHDLAGCGYFVQSKDKCKLAVEPELCHQEYIELLLQKYRPKTWRNSIYYTSIRGFVWRWLFKKSIIISNNLWFDEKLFFGEDLVFLLQYISIVGRDKIIYIDRALYTYYQRCNSASGKKYKAGLLDNSIRLRIKLVQLIMESDVDLKKRDILVSRITYQTVNDIIKNESGRAQGKYLADAFRELHQKKLSLIVSWSAIRQALFDGKLKYVFNLLLFKCKFYRLLSFLYRFKPK